MEECNYKRIILPQAESDIAEVLNYISNTLCNPDASIKLLDDIAKIMENVSRFPYSLPILKDKRLTSDKEYRRADVNNFVLIYRISEDVKEVRVMAALYAQSDVVSRLLKRM